MSGFGQSQRPPKSGSDEGPVGETAEALSPEDRRRFPRVNAPIFFRSPSLRAYQSRVHDISLGGLRVFCDECFAPGERLSIELFLPGESSVTCQVRVAWQRRLGMGAPARFDVGLELVAADERVLARLAEVLRLEG